MPFSFSFSLSLPGITNPFTAQAEALTASASAPALPARSTWEGMEDADVNRRLTSLPPRRRRRPPSPSLLPPLVKKRGWVPSSSEISEPAPIHTSTSGYLDTPAKYRDLAMGGNDEDEIEEMVADLPPPKRRRTIAGSIVSTALSAALIGTAVGLTVYRLWRDRGKAPEALPPPPYEQGEWTPPQERDNVASGSTSPSLSSTAPRSRKIRQVAASRRTAPRHRKAQSRNHGYSPSPYQGSFASSSRPPIPSEFHFASRSPSEAPQEQDEDIEVDDQMSWMNDRLAKLIAEGQKALGREVVIMSEHQADEVDDGSGAWVEDDAPSSSASISVRRKHRPAGLNGLPPYSGFNTSPRQSASPSKPRFDTYTRADRAGSTESFHSASGVMSQSYKEDANTWQTSEMRESMERARAAYMQKRGLSS